MNAWRHGLVALGVATLLVFPQFGWLPMHVYPLVGLALCAGVLAVERRRFADVGLDPHALGWRPLLAGAGLALVFMVLDYAAIGPLLARWFGMPDLSAYHFVRRDFAGYLRMLALSWLVGGLYEELVFRGVLFSVLRSRLGDTRRAFAVSALATSALFAAYHVQLGAYGVAHAFVVALALSAVQARWPRNLWPLVAFHATCDCVAFTLIRHGWL